MPSKPRPWLLAVSGGADSVALVRRFADATPIVAHVNHARRGKESDGDEGFVRDLASRLDLRFVVTRFKPTPNATPAGLRERRYAWLLDEARRLDAAGIMTGHHAGDQAETVLLRLLRGGELHRLAIAHETLRDDIRIQRPLLKVSPETLRDELRSLAQPWREDSSNAEPGSARNRLRHWLADHPVVAQAALALAEASECLAAAIEAASPLLADRFQASQLAESPPIVDRHLARDWLGRLTHRPTTPRNVADLLKLCRDAASAAAIALPGDTRARRRAGTVWLEMP